MTGRLASSATILALLGCEPTPPPGDEPIPVRGDTGKGCEAGAARALIGQEASSALGAEAMRLTKAGALRWIPEGGVVTMDYRPDRLNIELDGANRVRRIRCG